MKGCVIVEKNDWRNFLPHLTSFFLKKHLIFHNSCQTCAVTQQKHEPILSFCSILLNLLMKYTKRSLPTNLHWKLSQTALFGIRKYLWWKKNSSKHVHWVDDFFPASTKMRVSDHFVICENYQIWNCHSEVVIAKI